MAVDVGQAAVDAVVADRSVGCGRDPAGAGSWRSGRGSNSHVFDCLESQFIRRPVAHTGFDTSTAEPGGEALWIVVAALGAFLEHRHAAKLRTPHDERVFQHDLAVSDR